MSDIVQTTAPARTTLTASVPFGTATLSAVRILLSRMAAKGAPVDADIRMSNLGGSPVDRLEIRVSWIAEVRVDSDDDTSSQ